MQTATHTLGVPTSRHSHRKRMARIYLAVISGLILVADALLLRFVVSDSNPWEILLGVLIGQIASTPFLITAIYRRMNWARFILIGLLFLVGAIFGLTAIYVNSLLEYRDKFEIALILIAVGLLMGANTWLIRSKRIQHLAQTGPSGERC
jgi:hypothetical protein